MPSAFPGVDPYLEAHDIWPDFHDALAAEMRERLNRTLPEPYYARLETRPEVGILDEPLVKRRIIPDVAVQRSRSPSSEPVAVLDQPRADISEGLDVTVAVEPLRHSFVEIRDAKRGHKLVTLIEIASPSNKTEGVDRKKYQKKQREVLDSDASLIELDLLRGGQRLLPNVELEQIVEEHEPRPDYLISVNRAWRRLGDTMDFQVFPFTVRDPLPCIPVPLRQDEPEVPLDLQYLANRAYDGGPYLRGLVDYTQAPEPPLNDADQTWANQLLVEQGLRPAESST